MLRTWERRPREASGYTSTATLVGKRYMYRCTRTQGESGLLFSVALPEDNLNEVASVWESAVVIIHSSLYSFLYTCF